MPLISSVYNMMLRIQYNTQPYHNPSHAEPGYHDPARANTGDTDQRAPEGAG